MATWAFQRDRTCLPRPRAKRPPFFDERLDERALSLADCERPPRDLPRTATKRELLLPVFRAARAEAFLAFGLASIGSTEITERVRIKARNVETALSLKSATPVIELPSYL
ncbi:MAG: hypothetical protein ABJB97_13305 [Acidobacteriota bacterium]